MGHIEKGGEVVYRGEKECEMFKSLFVMGLCGLKLGSLYYHQCNSNIQLFFSTCLKILSRFQAQ